MDYCNNPDSGRGRLWRPEDRTDNQGISPSTPPVANNGYYLHSYQLQNYSAACKPCNSGLKKNYFPIFGRYDLTGMNPRKMGAEDPLLRFPIGSLDIDPKKAISFRGIARQSLSVDSTTRLRGLATIVFFALDDVIA